MNHALLALVDIAFRVLQPIFMSTPIALGGLGLNPPAIGTVLSFFGILNVVSTAFFPQLADHFGVKGVYLMGITAATPCFSMFPIINYLARNSIERSGGLGAEVWVAVGLQVAMSVLVELSYCTHVSKKFEPSTMDLTHLSVFFFSGAVAIFIAAAAPNKASLGATNGLAQLSVSIVRAVGPALASWMYSLSIDEDHHYMNGGLVYYVTVTLSIGAIWLGSLLPKHPFKDMK